ncbi:hypothetical protein [Kribbella sp. NPDC055071]
MKSGVDDKAVATRSARSTAEVAGTTRTSTWPGVVWTSRNRRTPSTGWINEPTVTDATVKGVQLVEGTADHLADDLGAERRTAAGVGDDRVGRVEVQEALWAGACDCVGLDRCVNFVAHSIETLEDVGACRRRDLLAAKITPRTSFGRWLVTAVA